MVTAASFSRYDVCCSSCSRDTIKERVRTYLADSIQCQQHVSDFVVRQFSDAFLDECVDSITVYDLSASSQVHNIVVMIPITLKWCNLWRHVTNRHKLAIVIHCDVILIMTFRARNTCSPHSHYDAILIKLAPMALAAPILIVTSFAT